MQNSLESSFKQFSLETARLEGIYNSLSAQFKSIKEDLQETNTRLSGKISELDFVSHYLGTILQHVSQGIIFIDPQGIVTTYNRAAEEILGISSNEVLYHSLTSLWGDHPFGFSIQKALSEKKAPNISSVNWDHPNKSHLELEVESTFVISEVSLNPVQGLLLLIRNMTEIRRLQEVNHRQDRLKDLGEMAARLAHEIRNPLGSIRGFANLLQKDLESSPETKKWADYIVEGAEGLNRVVSNVLTYSRALHPHFEQVKIFPLIEDLTMQIKNDSHYHDNIHINLKTTSHELTMLADPSLMRSALLNLMVNAMEAMPQGGELEIEIKEQVGFALLSIKDTGEGISPENMEKLFSPFFTTKQAGNGLGLSEVYKVIQAHEGLITVSSKCGEGSLFKLKIPLMRI